MPGFPQRGKWLEEAISLEPKLVRNSIRPLRLVEPVADSSAFQGWRMESAGEVQTAYSAVRERSWSAIFDFGTHLVGRLSFRIETEGLLDCPYRLKLFFAELPAEMARAGEIDSPEAINASVGRPWLQDEIIVLDSLPAEVHLPRRYSFRYVKIVAEGNSPYYKSRVLDLVCEAESAVDISSVPELPQATPDIFRRIDRIGLRTLANCMQSVFEDGPKRDRRLWLGDFRLQALLNYASFKNYSLAKRCLLLFAGLSDDEGLVQTCPSIVPKPQGRRTRIFDYIAIYAASLHEYAKASGDWALAQELWPIALKQSEFVLSACGQDGVFFNNAQWWCFIDWSDADKTTPEQAVSIYSLKTTAALAKDLGREKDVAHFQEAIAKLESAAREKLFDAKRGVFVSGPENQVSWASQIWMTLAGVIEGKDAAQALLAAMNDPAAVPAVAPYLHHYLVEAMLKAGLEKEAFAHIEGYWGEMARLGADTFWEVFDPKDHKRSPYGCHLLNSACHAWSCTPSLFIRTP